MPLVSIVTVCRNAASTLGQCIDSVARQTYPRVEYIVIDGASTDDTPAILARHAPRIDILVSEPDRGIYDAMNKGIARATGEFILFLNADDHLAGPDAIAAAMTAIARQPHADIYYGSIMVRGPGHTMRHDPPPAQRAAEEMVLGCLPHQATFARRAVFDRTGPFDLRWRRHADYAWWMRVLGDPALRLKRIDALVASFALGGASSDLEKGQPEVFAIQNAASLYSTPAWDRRRLEMYRRDWRSMRDALARIRPAAVPPAPEPAAGIEAWQQAWLAVRVALAQAREEVGDVAPVPAPTPALALPRSLRSWLIQVLPWPVVRAVSWTKRRLLRR